MRRRVILLQPAFREYRRAFFAHAIEELNGFEVDLSVAHAHRPIATNHRGELWDTAPSRPLQALRLSLRGHELLVSSLPRGWRAADLLVAPEGLGYLTSWVALAGRVGKRFAVFGHGSDLSHPEGRALLDPLNRARMRSIDWWFAYNAVSAEIVGATGMPARRITIVNNTVDTTALARVAAAFSPTSKAALRRRLGIGDGPLGIFVGSLHPQKRIVDLIGEADLIRAAVPNFELLIVGDGQDTPAVMSAQQTRSWLHKLPADITDQRARYWSMADVALYQHWAGLAVNEALALGVPPVLGPGPHPPEASYVHDGGNGVVVQSASRGAYATAVAALLRDPARMAALKAAGPGSVPIISEMAERFARGVVDALTAPRRRHSLVGLARPRTHHSSMPSG